MGAYDNPQILQTPNYGEIYNRSFWNSYNSLAQVFARVEERDRRAVAEKRQTTNDIINFRNSINNIRAGDATLQLQTTAMGLVDGLNICLTSNTTTAEQKEACRLEANQKVNQLAAIGQTIGAKNKELKNVILSGYQRNPDLIGLGQAYENGAFRFKFNGDDLEIYFQTRNEDGALVNRAVDTQWLADAANYDFNDMYDTNKLNKQLQDLLKSKISKSTITTGVQTDTGTSQVTTQQWLDGYDDINTRKNGLIAESGINNLDDLQIGSIYVDYLLKNKLISKDDKGVINDEKLINIIRSKNLDKSIEEDLIKNISNGFVETIISDKDGNAVNTAQVLGTYVKQRLIDDAVDNVQLETDTRNVRDTRTTSITPLERRSNELINKIEGRTEQQNLDDLTQYYLNEGFTVNTDPKNPGFLIVSAAEEVNGKVVSVPKDTIKLSDTAGINETLATVVYGDKGASDYFRNIQAQERRRLSSLEVSERQETQQQEQAQQLPELDRLSLADAELELQQNMSIINQIDNYDKNNIERGQFGINANREDIAELSNFLPADIVDPNLDKTFILVGKIRSYKDKLIERNQQLEQVVRKRKVSDIDIENDIDNKTSQINSLKSITESEQFKTSSFYNYQGKRVRGARILQVIKQLENDIKELQQRQSARLARGEGFARVNRT
tara:strand:- start:450 stop:2459 length:2010 start_codon:yes stop_codon:yes gene_type:complete